ncbi:AraC family ligand binding domain-containing protein [Microvirga pakistanensis]|uniref:AraC family ligand binding domain-containing protein n=1 Tax=Microvirga pakistanensis TaxID=1682650 RepID=UPI00313D15E5
MHHDEDKIFHVIEDVVRYRIGDQERCAPPGETLLPPKGIPHTYQVESAEARRLTITRGEFENSIRAFGRPSERDGLPGPLGPPTPEQAEVLAHACQQFE